jgi:hypothetical protein
MDHFVARANIDHYLGLLDSSDLAPNKRPMIIKLLIEEEDKLSHDLEQLEFAEERFARCIQRMGHLTKLRDGFADGSTDRARAEMVLATFGVSYQLTEQFYRRMRQKADGHDL